MSDPRDLVDHPRTGDRLFVGAGIPDGDVAVELLEPSLSRGSQSAVLVSCGAVGLAGDADFLDEGGNHWRS